MINAKMRVFDCVAIVGFFMLPALFSTGLPELVKENNTAAWITLLWAVGVMTLLFLLISHLMKRYEGRHIIDITALVMGKPWGTVYGLGLCVYIGCFTGLSLGESAETLKVYGLGRTPLAVIVGLIFLAALLINLLGERVIVKTAGFFFVIMLLGLIYVMLLGLGRYNPDRLMPVLGYGVPTILKNGLFSASLFDGVLVLCLLPPSLLRSSGLRRSGLLSLALGACAFVPLCLCFTMMFTPSVGGSMASAVMEMGKSSYYNHFFDRFESILLLFLICSVTLQASAGLWIAHKSIVFALKPKGSKLWLFVCAAPVAAALCLPGIAGDLAADYLPLIRRYGIFFTAGFPLVVLAVHWIKRVVKHETN